MTEERKWSGGLKVLAAAGLLVAGLAACDGELLDVEDPDNVEPSEELAPTDVSPRVAGMINELRTAYDLYALYSGLLTDEFILAGTFPTRREVDQRNPIAQNVSINVDVWEPLSVTRAVADQNIDDFEAALGTDEFSGQTGNLETGIAWGNLVAGYSRLFMAELFCHSILGGGSGDLPRFVEDENVEDAPLSSVDRARDALDFFEEAEARGEEFESDEVRLAALVGQARTHMLLHSLTDEDHLAEAEAAASAVVDENPRFVSAIEYSARSPGEENGIFQLTWGINASLRWTVGDGTDGSRGNERFAYYGDIPVNEDDEPDLSGATGWVGQGLIVPPFIAEADAPAGPGLGAFNNVSPVSAQTLYAGRSGGLRDVSIPLATAWEAQMILAEIELRNGSPGDAEDRANALLGDVALNPMTAVNSALSSPAASGDFTPNQLGAFEDISLDHGTLAGNLAELARAYEAGLWMTGHRQHFLRRMAEEFDDRFFPREAAPDFADNTDASLDDGSLWPDHGFGEEGADAGDAITLPLPVAEVDNNNNVGSACPAGYP
ncbi:MAG: hypothetical protein ACOC83_02800 [Gemmatimonadota bacterium]